VSTGDEDPAGPGAQRRPLDFGEDDDARWAHRRDPDLAPTPGPDREQPPAPARMPPGASRYTWFLGLVIVLVAATIMVNATRREGPSARGLATGQRLPPFAAPLAAGRLEGDVNVMRPSGGDAGACGVRGADVLNSCELVRRGPVALAFLVTRSERCTRELDALERVRARHPAVQIAAVAIRGDRGDLRALVRDRRWSFPVGYDRDGILANVFGVAACPHVTYALPGGRIADTSVGEVGARTLDRHLRALEREARAQGWRAP
jgi:hypothetical protein